MINFLVCLSSNENLLQKGFFFPPGCTSIMASVAAVIIVVAVVCRHRLKAIMKGPWGTELQVDASHPVPRPGVDILSPVCNLLHMECSGPLQESKGEAP